jgi:hypothetical protein
MQKSIPRRPRNRPRFVLIALIAHIAQTFSGLRALIALRAQTLPGLNALLAHKVHSFSAEGGIDAQGRAKAQTADQPVPVEALPAQ